MQRPVLRICAMMFAAVTTLAACGNGDDDTSASYEELKNSTTGGMFGYSFEPGTFSLENSDNPILTRMDAMIGIPDAHEPRPVVYIVHGDHPDCTNGDLAAGLSDDAVTVAWPEVCGPLTAPGLDPEPGEAFPKGDDWIAAEAGLSYLANSLREAGFVTVAIDRGAAGANITSEVGTADQQLDFLIKQHQQLLADFANGETHGIAMPANTSEVLGSDQYAVVGHSVGGGYALKQAVSNTDPNLFGVVGLEPALDAEISGADAAEPTPTLIFWGTCDEDATYDYVPQSLQMLKDANPDLTMSALKVDGATHAGANSNLNQELILDVAAANPGCDGEGAIMTPEVMQRGFAAEITSFLEQAADGASEFTLPADADFTPSVIEENGITVTFEQTTLPDADVSSPDLQPIDEQLLDPWDSEKFPPISAEQL